MAATLQSNLSGLARALVQKGRLAEREAEALQAQANAAGVGFIEQLISAKKMREGEIAEFASQTFGFPLLDLATFDQDHLPKKLIDEKLMVTRRVLPLVQRGNRLFVAFSDPTNRATYDEIKFQTGLLVDAVVVEDSKLLTMIQKVMKANDVSLSSLVTGDDIGADLTEALPEPEPDQSGVDIDDAPVVKYIQKILLDAINSGASEIHFEPYEKYYRVRYRTDGILYEVAQPPLAIKEKIASRIKVISKLDISEKRVPQDGRMKLTLSKTRAIDFRVSTLPTLFGEKIVMRILDPSSATLGIEALGYENDQKEQLLAAVSRPYGMVLVTGPTGSGKTVAL